MRCPRVSINSCSCSQSKLKRAREYRLIIASLPSLPRSEPDWHDARASLPAGERDRRARSEAKPLVSPVGRDGREAPVRANPIGPLSKIANCQLTSTIDQELECAFVLHCARVDHYSPCALCDLVLGNALPWSVWRRFCCFPPARSITSARYQKCKRNMPILRKQRRSIRHSQRKRLPNLVRRNLWPNTNTSLRRRT
jgi:hypothetical protein